MNKAERERFVLEKLIASKRLSLQEVMDALGVSQSTARRIFNNLESSGKAIRTHGGISLLNENLFEYSFDSVLKSHVEEKRRIGKAAAGTLRDGEVIYVDCGTTALSFCLNACNLIKEGNVRDIKIFTNSLANVEILSEATEVTLIGGTYRPNRKDFAGYIAESAIKQLQFDKCFLGSDGVAIPLFGATDFDTARLNQLVIAKSKQVALLCDSSKFGKKSLISFAQPGEIHTIITDANLSPAEQEKIKRYSIELILT